MFLFPRQISTAASQTVHHVCERSINRSVLFLEQTSRSLEVSGKMQLSDGRDQKKRGRHFQLQESLFFTGLFWVTEYLLVFINAEFMSNHYSNKE